MTIEVLDLQDIQMLHQAAITGGLADRRAALLAGVHSSLVATLPASDRPSDQLLLDLHALNSAQVLADGTVPLIIWIYNAAILVGPRLEKTLFEHMLRRCQLALLAEPHARFSDKMPDSFRHAPRTFRSESLRLWSDVNQMYSELLNKIRPRWLRLLSSIPPSSRPRTPRADVGDGTAMAEILESSSTPTMATDLADGLLIAIHSSKSPTSAEWEAYLDLSLRQMQEQGRLCIPIRQLVVTDGGAPNLKQRKLTAERFSLFARDRAQIMVAVVSTSAFVRFAATAMSAANPDVRVFRPEHIEEAFLYLRISDSNRVWQRIERLRALVNSKTVRTPLYSDS